MKIFIFSITHALPTAMCMTEEGVVKYSHGGLNDSDARYWLHYHHPDIQKDYEVVELNQELIEAHLYKGADLTTLPEDFVAVFRENQRRGEEEKAKKLLV